MQENSEDASSEDSSTDEEAEETEIQVFIAASPNTVMTELADMYNEEHPKLRLHTMRTVQARC